MNEQCAELEKLYQEIPVYGDGTHLELYRVYMKARPIILGIVAKEEHKTMQQALGVSSVEIDNMITWAGKAKTKKEKETYFIRASEQLGEDIKTAMGLIGCK